MSLVPDVNILFPFRFTFRYYISVTFNPIKRDHASSVTIVTDLRVERPGFDSRQGYRISIILTESRPGLGPTQLPIRWILGAIFPGVTRPGREADDSPPSSAEVKNVWSYTSTLSYVVLSSAEPQL
jgi:hypothetical protein